MTTNDVFSAAVTAMSAFGDVPLGGEVYGFDVYSNNDIRIKLDDAAQPAQALMAWLGSVSANRYSSRGPLFHHHSDTATFVVVTGNRAGLHWDLHAVFTGDDASVLCDLDDCKGSQLPVHRLRQVQMRQLAKAVAA